MKLGMSRVHVDCPSFNLPTAGLGKTLWLESDGGGKYIRTEKEAGTGRTEDAKRKFT